MFTEGPYWIKSIQSGKCIDICQDTSSKYGTAILYDYFGGKNQQFIIKKGADCYIIQSTHSGKVVELAGGIYQNGTVVRENEYNGGTHQKWKIVQTSPKSQEYLIVSCIGNKVMDVCNQKKSNGTPIFLYDPKYSHNQIWQFISADDGDYPLKSMGTCKSYYK